MSYNILYIPPFERQLKRLSKKYPSIKNDIGNLLEDLKKMPEIGIPIGQKCYKVRVAISSKGKGKSGGARVITTVYKDEKTLFLLSIYDKGEQETLSDKELSILLSLIP